ncbi:MAG: methylase [Akkermansiaceae bacterium]|nr:methylase [Akkermansiaceae bacterium]
MNLPSYVLPRYVDYLDFLKSKIPTAEACGFEPPSDPNASLYPHQVDICSWAIRMGRCAIFAKFGLGKTRMHLQLGWWVAQHTGGRFLMVAPLGVRQEFTKSDGPAMGIPVHFVRTTAEVLATKGRIFLTNYESIRDGKIDLSLFKGAGLDEASILRSFGSKTYQTFLPLFAGIPYRFVFTATPSPNRYKELIHYGGFLGIMDTGEALTRFFQRDPKKAGNLTLYPHMEHQFWHWLASWSVFLTKPSDLGYPDHGYDLPEIHIHWHRLDANHREAWKQTDSWGQSQLFLDQSQGLVETAHAKRESIAQRVFAARELIAAHPDHLNWLLWHDLEDERREIEHVFGDTARTVFGKQDMEEREELIIGFGSGTTPFAPELRSVKRKKGAGVAPRILATKPSLAGSGCNFQRHCSHAIFLGVGYKFNDLIQAVHRIHRFQQPQEVHIHLIYMDSEDALVSVLQGKWSRHEALVERQTALLRQYRLNSTLTMELARSLVDGAERTALRGQRFEIAHNDCVLELLQTPDDSHHLQLTSIPFGNQYEYSPTFNDFGHNPGDAGFFAQMDHLVPQLLRTLKPGRICAVHVKDRILFAKVTGHGSPTVSPFSDKVTACFLKHGFVFMARITVDTDVVRENNQTYRLGWTENSRDGTKMGAGMPEYVLVFRKLPTDCSNGYADEPVPKDKADYTRADWQLDAAGVWKSSGNRLLDPEVLRHLPHAEIKRLWLLHGQTARYDHPAHVALAKALEATNHLPSSFMLFPPVSRNPDIWTDIQRINTLNSEQSRRNQENHVCPLQLDLIERLIRRYSAPGELVFDPFMGIGSVPYQALKMGRRAGGTELNPEYFRSAGGYCEIAEADVTAPTLFDLDTLDATAPAVDGKVAA